ncbi:IS630 family transposase [Streptomyces kronopolitis]|uniref:IS630 family transposase n=1 Tax=Streptomyces kronopolitis TaxID=1612435 RepID=UPI003F562B70
MAPHRSQTSRLSNDPLFLDKARDVVGLYLDPPEKALVLCEEEKSPIQALDRSRPMLPMAPGVPERRSHDYVRAGTTTLFAALEVATGRGIGSLHRRHRAVEFEKFVTKLDKEVPADLEVHLILDNYVTHKTPAIKKWLLSQSRFHLHFTPTRASCLNLVTRGVAELTQRKLKRGVHRSVQALEHDTYARLADWNEHRTPCAWTMIADEKLDKSPRTADQSPTHISRAHHPRAPRTPRGSPHGQMSDRVRKRCRVLCAVSCAPPALLNRYASG